MEAQALAFTDQEWDAELVFQPLQGAADGALRQGQLLGRGGSGAETIDSLQRHQGRDRRQVTAGEHYEFPS
jgi:polysaccharide deacetylase 2 family uncharacterized protein YibQ